MKEITFSVPTIHCDHCTHTVEMELSELEGVKSVQADLGSKKVTVSYQEPATEELLVGTLREINYPPEFER